MEIYRGTIHSARLIYLPIFGDALTKHTCAIGERGERRNDTE